MTFNDTTTKNGLIQECETWLFGSDYGAISNNTNQLHTFTRLLNNGLDETATLILQTDGKWSFDDQNYTDYPIAYTDLVAGQKDYTLDVSHFKIIGVEVKDSEGNYVAIPQINYRDIRQAGQTPTEFYETDGMPVCYEPFTPSLFLYPSPSATDVTLTAGLKLRFQRNPSYFVYTDTTKAPGIPSIFHDIPVLFACAKYAKSNSMNDKARELDNEIARRKADMKAFFNTRDVDVKKRLRPAYKITI